jgi:MoxR-like ATPase
MYSMDLQVDRLVGREVELQRLCQILRADQDVVIVGVPGIGRHQLLRSAARLVGDSLEEVIGSQIK